MAIEEDRLGPAFGVQLALGLRRGEVLGLRWCDVELDSASAVVHVRQQLQRNRGAGSALTELKTAQSRRDLVLPAPMVAALRRHRVPQSTERLAAWTGAAKTVWVGVDDTIGSTRQPDRSSTLSSETTTNSSLPTATTPPVPRHRPASWVDVGVPTAVTSETLAIFGGDLGDHAAIAASREETGRRRTGASWFGLGRDVVRWSARWSTPGRDHRFSGLTREFAPPWVLEPGTCGLRVRRSANL